MAATKKITLRQTIPLQKRKILKQNLHGVFGAVVVWGLFTALGLALINIGVLKMPAAAQTGIVIRWIAVLGLLLIWKLGYPILYFATYFYDVEGDNLVIRKGVFATKEVTLPFSRITDVYVDQDMLDVFFGLSDLHISTPTVESGQFAHIDGLSRKGAAALRELILKNINTKKVEAAAAPQPISAAK